MKNIRSDLKIIVVGNANTGKTSFVNKWTKNQFHDTYKATIVSEFGYKVFEFNNKVYRIQIWDLAGQDKSISMSKIFCKDSHGVIVLSDISDKQSLDATTKWKKSIDDNVTFFDGTPLPMILIENKIDLVDEVEREECKVKLNDFSVKNGFVMNSQISVKKGVNVDDSMHNFLEYVIMKTESLKNIKGHFDPLEEKNSIIISPKDIRPAKSNKDCCV